MQVHQQRLLRDYLLSVRRNPVEHPEQAEIGKAIAVQAEISECWMLLAGPGAPETITARADLGTLLMLSAGNGFES
jgi:hypothetical protein